MPKTVHQVLLNDEYIAESQRVQIGQNPTLRFMYQTWWTWWIPRVLVVGMIVFCLVIHVLWDAVIFAGFLLLSFFGEWFGKHSLAKARNRTRGKGTTTTVSVGEGGIDIAGAFGNSHLKWEGLRKPVVKADGVLLKLTNLSGLWLPDRMLVEGTPKDIRQLISAHFGTGSGS